MLKKICLSIISIVYFFNIALAQDKVHQNEGEAIKVDTELIQVDVIVTDKKGNRIDSLKQSDFELLEDGKVQSISFFSLVQPQTKKNLAKTTSINPDKKANIDVPLIEQAGRVFIILIDDIHISATRLADVKKQLLKLVNEQFQENDKIAVISSSGMLGILELTAEREPIKKSIEKLKPQIHSDIVAGDTAKLTEFQAQQIVNGEFDYAAYEVAITRYLENTTADKALGTAVRQIQSNAQQILDKVVAQTTITLQTIRNVMLALRSVPGRKNLILVTDGFLVETQSEHLAQMRSIVDLAARVGVVVYSLNSGGLKTSSNYSAEDGVLTVTDSGETLALEAQKALLGPMKSIAQDTGGFSTTNSNDLLKGLQNVVKESSSYYLLAYYPENVQEDAKFREIKVNVKGNKQLIVKTRKGYISGKKLDLAILTKSNNSKKAEKIEKSEGVKNAEKIEKVEKQKMDTENASQFLLNEIKSAISAKDIKLKIKADFLGGLEGVENNNTLVSLALDLKDIDFQKIDNHYQNKIKGLLVIFAEDGKIVHSTQDDINLNFTDDNYKQMGKTWFFFGKSLSLKPGFYNVRFAAEDPITHKIGSCSALVEIPDLKISKLQLSNILLLHQENPQNPESVTMKGQALTVFTEKSSIGFLCYILGKENLKSKLIAQIQILQEDKAIFTSSPVNLEQKVDKVGRIVYGGQVPLIGFAEGQYKLRIIISDDEYKTQVAQEQIFTIEK